MKVIQGGFGKKTEEDKPTASDVYQILADELDGVDGVECLAICYVEGEPLLLAGNVEMDAVAMLLMLAQASIVEAIYGGGDETVH